MLIMRKLESAKENTAASVCGGRRGREWRREGWMGGVVGKRKEGRDLGDAGRREGVRKRESRSSMREWGWGKGGVGRWEGGALSCSQMP